MPLFIVGVAGLFSDICRTSRATGELLAILNRELGADLRSLPLSERRRRLQTILPAGSPAISEALSVAGRGASSSS